LNAPVRHWPRFSSFFYLPVFRLQHTFAS